MSFALVHQSKNKTVDSDVSMLPKRFPHHHDHINNLSMDSRDSIIHLQLTFGNQVVQRLMSTNVPFNFAKIGILQPKLKVSQPGDAYEQEADRVAEQVMRMSISDPITSNMPQNHERIDRRKCSSCEMKEKEEEEKRNLNISRKPSTISNLETTTDEITNEISSILPSQGTSLDENTREFMESRFGYDFSNVRIHTNEKAA